MAQTNTEFENSRVAALHEYDVLDTPPEASFDRITRLAQIAVQTPIVLVSLIDRDRQWFKSRIGLDATETARDTSFCTHAIVEQVPLIVEDAREHPRFKDNPNVLGEPYVRFYAGVPLRTPAGYNIGTLCAVDYQPRELSSLQLAVLQDLARLVVDELELRRLATTDSLTGAATRRFFAAEVAREVERARRHGRPLSCLAIDVDHFKKVNDRYGHAAGDRVLQACVTLCRARLRAVDLLGRMGGEEFAVALPETPPAAALVVAERLRAAIQDTPVDNPGEPIRVTASIGVATLAPGETSFDQVLARADKALYAAKNGGRNRTVVDGA
ncbi:MAG: diguanylate cyclase [Alphaproteobacteria bacterium]